MKKFGKFPTARTLTAGFLLLLLAGSSVSVLAVPAGRGRAAEIAVSGSGENGGRPFIKLDGEQALSGRTFFAYSTLETPQNVSADVSLPGLGRVSLTPGTTLSLGFTENSITGKLQSGKIRVLTSKGTAVVIETPDDRITNDSAEPGIFTVDLTSGTSEVAAESGAVFNKGGKPAGQAQTATAASSILVPVLVFSGIVATAAVVVLLDRNNDDDNTEDAIVSGTR